MKERECHGCYEVLPEDYDYNYCQQCRDELNGDARRELAEEDWKR